VPTTEFTFVDNNRTFNCRTEARGQGETWWWFEVSTDRTQRYAPFRAAPGDKKSDVQARIVTYYDELLVRRAAPAVTNHWRGRAPNANANANAAAAATAAAAAPAKAPTAD
jgi:hypothetical protein